MPYTKQNGKQVGISLDAEILPLFDSKAEILTVHCGDRVFNFRRVDDLQISLEANPSPLKDRLLVALADIKAMRIRAEEKLK